jgi:hypothetical protein
VVGDVFEQGLVGVDLVDNSGDMGPEVPGILLTLLEPSARERLAGITGNERLNASAPRSAIEGFEIAPDRSRIEGAVFKARRQLEGCRNFDFHVADGASLWASDS